MNWRDSYPYAGISVFALHPLYLDPAPLLPLLTAAQRSEVEAQRQTLNALSEVDYERVLQLKWRCARLAFAVEGRQVLQSSEFSVFFDKNRHWLIPYAVFCCLRDLYGTADFSQWQEYAVYSPEKVAALLESDSAVRTEAQEHYYMQFLLHSQLLDAAAYCRSLDIKLKGDIPIGISPRSAEAWTLPHLFNMDMQAGAPPDAFSATGQNWGFPTYNWDAMAHDGYAWWRSRLSAMAQYFDAVRLDHVLGFFRIWEIPRHSAEGLLGRFSPALPLSIKELTSRGAWFDAQRLCQPYVRSHVLKDMFGAQTNAVIAEFFEEYRSHCFRFKENVSTQQKLLAYFAANPACPALTQTKLMALSCEVILLEDTRQGLHFHPRIGMHSTRSYQELDAQQQKVLDDIYIDFFYHRHNSFWAEQALAKLPALLSASKMLVCGEDLGMVPLCVPQVMAQLGLLGLVIGRMSADSAHEFAALEQAPERSVCSTGTHDMSTLRQWWKEDSALTQRFYNNVLLMQGDAPAQCSPEIACAVVWQYMRCPSALAIFPLQDLLAMDIRLRRRAEREERINIPANASHYWRYRMHLDLEDLLREDRFAALLKEMTHSTGRS
jgi:4-alpha-glucanotransferase